MIHGKKRNGDLFKRLTESWGYSKPETEEVVPLDEEMAADAETVTEEEEAEEEQKMEEGVFDVNHYCIHHGGVHHNGSIEMAEAVRHADPDASGHVSHYDMKLADGTILENVAAEDIQVTNASLAKEHMHKRDAAKADDEEEEVQAEGGRADRDHEANRRNTERTRPKQEAVKNDEEEALDEAAEEEEDAKLEETLRRLVTDALNKIRNS